MAQVLQKTMEEGWASFNISFSFVDFIHFGGHPNVGWPSSLTEKFSFVLSFNMGWHY